MNNPNAKFSDPQKIEYSHPIFLALVLGTWYDVSNCSPKDESHARNVLYKHIKVVILECRVSMNGGLYLNLNLEAVKQDKLSLVLA